VEAGSCSFDAGKWAAVRGVQDRLTAKKSPRVKILSKRKIGIDNPEEGKSNYRLSGYGI
jgi:hypothetical protein